MMVQSFYIFSPASSLRRVLLHFCVVSLWLRGYGTPPVRSCCAVLFLFLYFSFLFLEVFELYSPNISLTVSCSPCFINTAKYDKHTLVFVFPSLSGLLVT